MSIVLALSAMLLLGSTHFINGLLARFYPPLNIGFYTHLGGALGCFIKAYRRLPLLS